MNQHYRETRKIDPTKGTMLSDGSPNDADRVRLAPPNWPSANGRRRASPCPISPRCATTGGSV